MTASETINVPSGCTVTVASPLGDRVYSGPVVVTISGEPVAAVAPVQPVEGRQPARRAIPPFDWPILDPDRQAFLDALWVQGKSGKKITSLILTGQLLTFDELHNRVGCGYEVIPRTINDMVLAGCDVDASKSKVQLRQIGTVAEAVAVVENRKEQKEASRQPGAA